MRASSKSQLIPPGPGDVFRFIVGIVILVLAHFSVRPLLAGHAEIDFLLIAVLFIAVRVRPGVAALTGLCAGLIVDSLNPAQFGAATLAFSLTAYGASWLKAVFFAENVALTGVFIFVGKWLFDAVYLLAGRGVPGVDKTIQLLLWSPLAASLTAIVAVMLLTFFRPLYRARTY